MGQASQTRAAQGFCQELLAAMYKSRYQAQAGNAQDAMGGEEMTCIPFDGPLDENGYGRIGKQRAHRVTWEAHNGPIPDRLHVLHSCDSPACINLDHLFLGTHQDNMADRDRKNRQARPRGTDNGRSVLSEYDAFLIKVYLRLNRLSLNEIAEMFGVCKSTIVHIKMDRQWRHV